MRAAVEPRRAIFKGWRYHVVGVWEEGTQYGNLLQLVGRPDLSPIRVMADDWQMLEDPDAEAWDDALEAAEAAVAGGPIVALDDAAAADAVPFAPPRGGGGGGLRPIGRRRRKGCVRITAADRAHAHAAIAHLARLATATDSPDIRAQVRAVRRLLASWEQRQRDHGPGPTADA